MKHLIINQICKIIITETKRAKGMYKLKLNSLNNKYLMITKLI